MDTNAYTPPQSDIEVRNDEPGSIVKAVAVGATIDIVGSVLIAIVWSFVYGFILAAQGATAEQILQTAETFDPLSPSGLTLSFVGLFVSMAAGYTCARIANTKSYKAAYIVSAISFSMGIAFGLSSYSFGILLIMGLLSIGAVLLGARMYIQKL